MAKKAPTAEECYYYYYYRYVREIYMYNTLPQWSNELGRCDDS